MAVWNDGFDFPTELCNKPQALVGISGIDVAKNVSDREVWEALSNNRASNRALINFKLLGPQHGFPPMKPKRNTYDWYIPKGILKRNWIIKHLQELPAVNVLFFHLDWDDPNFAAKKLDCANRLQSIRGALKGRLTRLAVVLIQRTAPVAGEDPSAADKANALCTACELNPKCLFVLPLGDHLQGYILRLEKAFLELAQGYYHHAIRAVKSHRDQLNKTTQQYLMVRHLFKIGFLSELKQDSHNAHKSYAQAYSQLLDLRVADTNAMEVKTVAGLINYKICRILFFQSMPRDAIAQFRAHSEAFKNREGHKDLVFEHYGWLAKQYWVFGDLFDEAIKQGVQAVQTQHPGFYYQQAAQFAIQRKQSCEQLCQNVTTYPEPDPLTGVDTLEFFGQRPWRPGSLSVEPIDPNRERDGILALQFREKIGVNHSSLIITLFGIAISQFKAFRCPRMRRQLLVQMAEEYFSAKDYGKALTVLTHMLWDYRSEKWWRLLSAILLRALGCAYLTAGLQDYVTLSLEALGDAAQLSLQDKTRIFQNLNKILKRQLPDPEPGLSNIDLPHAKDLWTASCASADPPFVTVDMSNVASCVESKARFTSTQSHVDKPVLIEVFVKSACPHSIKFSKLLVTVTTPSMSTELPASIMGATEDDPLLFETNTVKVFLCQFIPDQRDVGSEIQITSILLHMGSEGDRNIILRYSCVSNESGGADDVCPELQHFRPTPIKSINFDSLRVQSTTHLVPRTSLLDVSIQHDTPALLGEWYKVHIEMLNNEQYNISSLSLDIALIPSVDDPHQELTTQLCKDVSGELVSLPMQLVIGDLPVNSKKEVCFYVRALRLNTRNLLIKAKYLMLDAALGNNAESWNASDKVVTISVVKPFDVLTKFVSLQLDPLTKGVALEPLIAMPHTECLSPWPIVIHNSSFELAPNVSLVDETFISQLQGLELQKGEMAAEASVLTVSQPSDQPVHVGTYQLQWSRKGQEHMITSSTVTLPTLRVENAPIYVEMVLPAHGWVRTPMAVSYRIHNHTSRLIDVDLSMEASDAFMFAGHKQLQLCLLPESVRTLDYNLYPLLSGLVALPRLCLSLVKEGQLELPPSALAELLQRCLPTHVYVMPQAKGKSSNSQIPVPS